MDDDQRWRGRAVEKRRRKREERRREKRVGCYVLGEIPQEER